MPALHQAVQADLGLTETAQAAPLLAQVAVEAGTALLDRRAAVMVVMVAQVPAALVYKAMLEAAVVREEQDLPSRVITRMYP